MLLLLYLPHSAGEIPGIDIPKQTRQCSVKLTRLWEKTACWGYSRVLAVPWWRGFSLLQMAAALCRSLRKVYACGQAYGWELSNLKNQPTSDW